MNVSRQENQWPSRLYYHRRKRVTYWLLIDLDVKHRSASHLTVKRDIGNSFSIWRQYARQPCIGVMKSRNYASK